MYALLLTVASVAIYHDNSPFLVKDNHYANDKPNTGEGGTVLPVGRYSSDATVISKLCEARGVLHKHAALSEPQTTVQPVYFSDGSSTRIGQTRNPFNLTQATSGSKGGSAV